MHSKNPKPLIQKNFSEHLLVVKESLTQLEGKIAEAIERIAKSLQGGGTLFWAGNGGSAADAQHMAAELVGRFKQERKPIKSIALTTNLSTLTAIGNDYAYEKVFCRELEAFSVPGDVLVAISTSGNSKNILEVSKLARQRGVQVIALTGETGGDLRDHADLLLNVPSQDTARVQEVFLMIEHTICEAIDDLFSST
jgi:D-sedoheptulose 7-phosphate isomerase